MIFLLFFDLHVGIHPDLVLGSQLFFLLQSLYLVHYYKVVLAIATVAVADIVPVLYYYIYAHLV